MRRMSRRQLAFETAHRKRWLSKAVPSKRYLRAKLGNIIQDRINSRNKNQQTTDPHVRAIVLRKTGGKCYLCMRQYTTNALLEKIMPHLFFTGLEIDHIVPFSKFGPNTISNYLPVCRTCNSRKSDLSLAEFRAGKRRGWRQ
jgi:CRISPR/Cas system Type II protein with McrA/HNH and RuvC-like nuclease domain